ncbi:TPA: hypothetical protein U9J56_001679 [Acinetobacter baumannii]|nr:hypothetical protein [Acinetobacter baumannii]
MNNKYISYISLLLILLILIQLKYFLNELNTDEVTTLSNKELSLKKNNISNEKIALSSTWSFSNGELPLVEVKNEFKKNINIITKNEKLKKEILNFTELKDTIPIYQNLSNTSFSNHNILYMGMANSNGELSFFFQIDNNYVYLKINDIYNNIKLISVGSSSIVLIDLVNNKEYLVSK